MSHIAFGPLYSHPLPDGHRFPMEKYDLLYKQLLHEGTATISDFFTPEKIHLEHVLRVHDSSYVQNLTHLKLTPREQRISGFPHSQRLIERELTIMEGTRLCAEKALETNGICLNIAGGTHHAFTNRGEGFCLLNDQAIAAKYLLENNLASSILIIDLDVHQGNGTAEIFQQEERVFTFSMHGKNNYPLQKEKSDLDVELSDGTNDSTYLYELEKNLDTILSRFSPDFVFYQSGVDVLASDKLGKMNLSVHGCKERDKLVFKCLESRKTPIACSMGGGYSPDIKIILEAHANTFREAAWSRD